MPQVLLVPFAPEPLVSTLVLTGAVDREGPILHAAYRLAGDLSTLVIPELAAESTRRDGLWRATCFELFVAPQGHESYLEVNLSPCGDWNAYSFTSYRAGMAPLAIARFTPRRTSTDPAALELDFALELDASSLSSSALEVAVTAVLEHTCGARSYWALAHTGDRPDFHRRDSFLLRL